MRRSTAITAVVALFLTGVLVGVLMTHLFYLRQVREPGGLARLGTRILAQDLQRRLDLAPEQRAEVDAILTDTAREAAALRREMAPRMLALLDRSRVRIRRVLTPEQVRELDRYRGRHAEKVRRLFLASP